MDRVVTTSLRRTGETADAAGLVDLPRSVDDRWREIDFGDLDDRALAEVMPELAGAWLSDAEYVPPNGESMAAMHRRIGRALDDLVHVAVDETIVVVTHATPVKSAVTWVLGGELEMIHHLRVDLASVTTFSPARGGLVMTGYNWCPTRETVGPASGPDPGPEGSRPR